MSEFRFYGASDDLLEIEGDLSDEYENPNGEFTLLLSAPEYGALLVHARFLNSGTWSLGVAPCDDGAVLPPWPIRIEPAAPDECEYSPTLVIDAPSGSEIKSADGRS